MPTTDLLGVLLAFLGALAGCLAIMPLAILLGRRFGWVVTPRLFGVGASPVPYVGGKALAVSALVAFVAVRGLPVGVGSFFAGSVAFLLLGFWDDRSADWIFAKPAFRLALQVAIAVAAFWSGFGSDTGGWAGGIGTVLFLVAAMNAFNLVDNMDGVAGSTAAAIASSIAVAAALEGQIMVSSLAAATCGASLGFLRFNIGTARVYLGNGGSLFVGFLLAGSALQLRPPLGFPWSVLVLPVLFAVPATDTAVAIISRVRSGRSVMQGGVDHISHRLIRLGFSKVQAALMHATGCLLSGTSVALALVWDAPEILLGVLGVFGAAGLWLCRLDMYAADPVRRRGRASQEGADA